MYQTADYAKYSAKTKAKLMTELLKNLESFLHYTYIYVLYWKRKNYLFQFLVLMHFLESIHFIQL